MKLFHTPGSCSLAPHILARELGIDVELIRVDLQTKRTEQDGDFLQINRKGSVPALVLDNGDVLTETSVILTYLGDLRPGALSRPGGDFGRLRIQEALNFVSTELHKTLGTLFNPDMPDAGKEVVLATARKRLDYLDQELAGGGYLAGDYSMADAYAFTILNWTRFLAIDLAPWPNVASYVDRIGGRAAVRAALEAEGLLPSPSVPA